LPTIYLVHHGDAVLPEVDPRRPLSPRGVEAVGRLATEAARRGARPACIWHSGKLRARQTAEAFWRACNPLAAFSAERGLQPTDPPEWMRDRLSLDRRDIMLVGHLPNLPRLHRMLLGHDPDESVLSFPLHGVVVLEPGSEPGRELWRLEP
jgi:phosphohistidine phosphatase